MVSDVERVDAQHMARALFLAERGRGRTSPNPMVGAVVLDQSGVVVGRGFHEVAGGPHAEVHALNEAGERARGGTLYCTLEPCSHTGRTAPCAPRVVAAGIARAIIAIGDPNPRVGGRGFSHLIDNGIDLVVGTLREQAERLNRPFFTLMRHARPLVTMKVALSLDGYVAASRGMRTQLTGSAATLVAQRERAEIDAIAIGSETVVVDDPLLTVRATYRYRPLLRVVFDRRLRTPVTARLFSTLSAGPLLVMTTAEAGARAPERVEALRAVGAQVELLQAEDDEAFLREALQLLGRTGVTSLLVEGGPKLHQTFWTAGLVDRVELFVTPRALGSSGVDWIDIADGSLAGLRELTATPVGEDVMIEGYVHRTD